MQKYIPFLLTNIYTYLNKLINILNYNSKFLFSFIKNFKKTFVSWIYILKFENFASKIVLKYFIILN
jgi:hypothetical protein